MSIASLLPLMLFVFPLWQISLFAPQYPNGVTMYIWINNITGDTPGTLQNINILNHYVGMGKISVDTFPELSYFPYVVVGMVLLGLVFAIINRKILFLLWGLLFCLLGAAGIYDFYLWEYQYGHNLSPEAPIKVPGMAYQPPLFGSKTLLNFIAESYPSWGAVFVAIAILTAFASFFLQKNSIS